MGIVPGGLSATTCSDVASDRMFACHNDGARTALTSLGSCSVSSSGLLYALALLLHGYLRWAVLVGGVASFVASMHGRFTGRPWRRADERLALAFVALTDLQLLLGLLLHLWLSPFSQAALASPRAALGQAQLWFFGFVHPTLMILGFVVAHVTRARSKRAASDEDRFAVMSTGLGGWLIVVLIAVPWPWLDYGRPLLRTGG